VFTQGPETATDYRNIAGYSLMGDPYAPVLAAATGVTVWPVPTVLAPFSMTKRRAAAVRWRTPPQIYRGKPILPTAFYTETVSWARDL
jgi:hypothetical protein